MLKRKLLKRVLPMILSISMVFGSMPETVFAAEYEERTITQETFPEEDEAVSERSENLEDTPASTGGGYTEAEESAAQETETAGTDAATDDNNVQTAVSEEAAEESEKNAEKALDTKLVVNKENLAKACTGFYKYDVDKEIVLVKYDADNSDPFSVILNNIQSANRTILSIEIDGETNNALHGSLKYQWQKADGTSLAEGAVPAAAGDYKLLVSLDAVENTCSQAEITLVFQIAKRQLSIALADEYVQPGTTVSAWKDNLKYELRQEDSAWEDNSEIIGEDEKSAYIESVSVEIYDAHSMESALSGETKLVEGLDYAAKVKPVLKQEASSNYAIPEEIVLNLHIADLITTQVKAEQKNPSESIAKVYDGEKFSYAALIKDKLNISVLAYDALNPEEGKVLENAAVTEVWFDSAKAELGEGEEAEPAQAGTYYLGFRYYPAEEDAKVYSEATNCQTFIKVVIERAPLTLVPEFKSTAETFYTGMKASDVLRYADYKLFDAANNEVTIDRNTFWGVSYDDGKADTMQSFEPVFSLIRAKKDADGNPVKDADGKEIWTADAGVLDKDYLYRLVFTGKKAVYKNKGNLELGLKGEVDVNGSDVDAEDKNHSIVTSEDVLFGKYVNVPVEEAKQTTIDVSGILQQGFNTKNLNELYQPAKLVSKVYDGAGIYGARGDYKKAVVTAADGTEAAKDYDVAIQYTWYRITGIEADYDETDPDNRKQIGWKVSKSSAVNTTVQNGIPVAAGEYMLQIRFAKTGYVPSTETIYYRIDKQQLVVDIKSIPLAYTGDDAARYLSNVHYQGKYDVYKVPQNQYSEAVKTEENLLTDWYKLSYYSDIEDYSGNCYKLDWFVEQAQKDADGKTEYVKLDTYDLLTETAADTYRLGVELKSGNADYGNYEIVYEEEMTPAPSYKTVYHNDYETITVSDTQGIEVVLALDETKLTTVKDYDGKPFYASKEEGVAAIENALTVTNAATGEVIPRENWPRIAYDVVDNTYADYYGYDRYVGLDEMLHGGSYALEFEVEGDETYRYDFKGEVVCYTINQIALDVTPALMEDIPAGTDTRISDGTVYDLSKTEFKGFAEADAAAFQYGTPCNDDSETKRLGFSAYYRFDDDNKCYLYSEPRAKISKAGSAAVYNGYIRYNTEYAVQFAGALGYPYVRDYKVNYVRKAFSATRRGNSKAQETEFFGNTAAFVQQNKATAVTITPISELPYIYSDALEAYDDITAGEGNYFAFRVNAPYEFMEDNRNYDKYADSFVYKNSIEAAGGFVYEEDTAGRFYVLFPVKDKTDKSFDIIWENGYTETYTIHFVDAVLQDDLTKAVAPKSLSFNSVNTKMAVGDEQQLDVKIKKEQIGDVIHIDYKVTQGDDVISITADDAKKTAGYATALKPGKAVVSAFPVRMVNGVKTPIEGAKAATVLITVSDVAAPAVKTLAAFDTRVKLQYVKPANGYRRELYVLEGKQKADAFESAIGEIQNGKWQGIFAAEPVYYSNETVTDAKTKLVAWKTINNLLPDKEYTIYVRNVSGIRTLADGSCVSLSAAGTVKSFKTSKPQIKKLRLRAKIGEDKFTTGVKTVTLSSKTEQLYTDGLFAENVTDPAADQTDMLWLSLPLDKMYGKTMAAPKLTYWVSASPNSVDPKIPDKDVTVDEIRDFRYYVYAGGEYYDRTDIATVDKKGKVTFKGVGTVYVHVRDDVTGCSASIRLNICATADSMTAKSAKLAVGRQLYLSSLLTYYEGKTALLGVSYHNYRNDGTVLDAVKGTTYKPNLVLPVETISRVNNEGNFYIEATGDGDYRICALKPNAQCSLTVADGALSATAAIQSAPIDPVKDFKITDVVDNGFIISFAYPVDTDLSGVKYRIDITDARGSLVDSFRWDAYDYTSCDGKKKTFMQTGQYQNDKIIRLSKYNVSVTALYGDEASAKPAKKTVKTTDFPASYYALSKAGYGGMPIRVYAKAGGTTEFNAELKDRKYLTSGNAYTLSAQVTTPANHRMTDTLTWKSSNTKVAAVKSKAGTYTAQLNALKPGSAVIEVTSKITKKVIARWVVFVKAVGNAETYYGDYEFTYEYPFRFDPYYTAKIEVMTLQNDVHVTPFEVENASYDYRWVKFTAPAKGIYTFERSDCQPNALVEVVSSMERQILASEINRGDGIWMTEGEALYFKLRGSFTMRISDYVKQGNNFTIDDDSVLINSEIKQIVEFQSTEDNVYTFYSRELPGLAGSLTVYDEKMNGFGSGKYRIWTDDEGIEKIDISLEDKEIIHFEAPAGRYTIYAEKRTPEELTDDGAALVLTDGVKEKWYIYTAGQQGLYTFKSKDATAVLTADYYESLKDFDSAAWGVANNGGNFSGKMTLKAGQKVILKISADEAATAAIGVTPEIPVNLSDGEEKELSVKTDDRRWVSFTVSEAGRYRFRAFTAESDADYQVHLRYYKNAIEQNAFTLVDEDEMIVSDKANYKPDVAVGDTIYVEITTDKEGGDAANVKVSLTQVRAVELKIGEPVSVTVKNNDVQWFSYTVPKDIRYVVQSFVTENIGADNAAGDTHKLTAQLFTGGLEQRNLTNTLDTIGAYDFVREKEFSTEKTESIRVSANDLGFDENGGEITTTAVIVLKEAVEPLAMNDPQELSLRTNERRWFSFTAPETNTYLFRSDITEGNFDLSYKNSMDSSDRWHSMNNVRHALDLEKDQTIYLDLSARRDTAAKLTFSVEFSDKLLGTAEKTVTVTSEAPAYFMYVTGSDELARYAVTYTKDAQDAAVSLFYDDTFANPNHNSITEGYAECNIEDRYFFKVSTTNETPVTVTVKIAKIEPMKLNVGVTENIPVAGQVSEENNVRRNTWCSFTAPETGRYVIDKTSSDFSTLSFYKKMTENAYLDWQNYYYEKGETIYVGLYTDSENAQTSSVEVKKIEATQIEGTPVSVTDQILTRGMLNTKGYLYTVPKTGLYTFTNQDTSRVRIKLYMDPSDNIGDTVTGSSPKSLFLKENGVIYVDVMATQDIANVKFTIEYAGEAQALSSGENTITFGGQSSCLTAFTAPDAGLYHFGIAYAGDSSVGAAGTAYLMKDSQVIGGTNNSLYSSMSGSAGSIAFANRLVAQGETVYLSVPKPSSATGAAISVSKAEETVKTETITEDIELERVFEDGDKVYYIFDVPEDGTYKLLAESRVDTGYCYYDIYYNRYGLSDADALKNAGVWNVVTSKKCNLGSLNKRQRIYLRADKTDQSGDSVSKLALTITRTQ
jgi:hypothetical protein